MNSQTNEVDDDESAAKVTGKQAPPPEINNIWQLLAWYAHRHGSLIFGLVTCLLMWQFMLVPELERNAIKNEIQRAVLEELRQNTKDQREVSEHLKTTAQILERITAKWENGNE